MSRNKIDKQSTWHCSSYADSNTFFFNLNIKDEFQTELLRLHLTLCVLHTWVLWWFFEALQHDLLAKEGTGPLARHIIFLSCVCADIFHSCWPAQSFTLQMSALKIRTRRSRALSRLALCGRCISVRSPRWNIRGQSPQILRVANLVGRPQFILCNCVTWWRQINTIAHSFQWNTRNNCSIIR